MSDDRRKEFLKRAREEYRREMKRIATIHQQLFDEEKDRDDIEEYGDPLCFQLTDEGEFEIQMSWGGPADGYLITFDWKGNPLKGDYYFQDWSTEKKRHALDETQLEQVLDVYQVDSYTVQELRRKAMEDE